MKYKKQIAAAAALVIIAGAAGIGGYEYYINRSAETVKEEPMVQEAETEEAVSMPTPENSEPKKEETVYVQAKADGTVRDIIVSDILRNGTSAQTITDKSDLKNIKNVKGKESYKKGENDEIIWQADGNDIYYQGKTDKELPVDVKVTYYLEGEEIAPEKLAGKSGNIKIRFDYINHETQTQTIGGEERTISVPFVAVTGVVLDEDKFMNVEMENGSVISDGSRIMAGGVAIPGLSDSIALSEVEDMDDLDIPEYLELSAYTTGFELSMTMTAITSDFSDEIDLDDLDSYEDLKDDMQELLDASTDLVDGTHELVDGVVELQDGAQELYDGAVDLDDGAKELKDGATQLDDGAYDLQDGALDLKDALKAYNAGLDELVAAMANAGGEGVDIATVAQSVKDGVDQVIEQVMSSALDTVNAQLDAKLNKNEQIVALNQVLDAMGQPVLQVGPFESLEDFLQYDSSGLEAYVQLGVPEEAIETAVQTIEAAQTQVKETQTQLATLQQGMEGLATGIAQIYGAATTQLQPASVKILDGARELYAGTKELKEGTEELLDGTVELKDGTVDLLDGTVELKDGVQELYDGSIELKDGMEEFDEDGIRKIYDMVCKDMQNVIDRARAVADAGEAYQTFTQIAPDMKGSVKFLIETDAIE